MSRVVLACAFVALLPTATRGEPISITSHSETGGFARSGDVTAGTNLDLGTLFLPGPEAAGTLFFGELTEAGNYRLAFDVSGLSGISAIKVELLEAIGKGNGNGAGTGRITAPGSSASSSGNSRPSASWSFVEGLERSIAFVGGSAVLLDEVTHRGNILILGGLIGAEQARVALEMRNAIAGRGFQLRFAAIGDTAPVPEPTSMLLVGSGLAGLAALYRRRRRSAVAQPDAGV